MIDTSKLKDASPWHPMTNSVDLKTLGKFCEELGECVAAVARCIIQGIYEKEPVTGKFNNEWLEDEVADIKANIILVEERFNLNKEKMQIRVEHKLVYLRSWHKMA